MTRAYLPAAILALAMAFASAESAQPLDQSPITPGFWAWPEEKPADAAAIASTCRVKFAQQFADGHFFGVRLGGGGARVSPPQIDEVGLCRFSRETQIEVCELRLNNPDGTVTTGTIESRFSTDAGVLKMTVTPIVSGARGAPFDRYPVQCPADSVWSALNEATPR